MVFAIFKPKAVVLLRLNVTNIVLYLKFISCSDAEGLVVHAWAIVEFQESAAVFQSDDEAADAKRYSYCDTCVGFFCSLPISWHSLLYTLHSFFVFSDYLHICTTVSNCLCISGFALVRMLCRWLQSSSPCAWSFTDRDLSVSRISRRIQFPW